MQGDSEKINVAFVPYYSDNPYQKSIETCLVEKGIVVEPALYLKNISILGGKAPALLHLHWLPKVNGGVKGVLRFFTYILRLCLFRLSGKKIVWTVHNLYSHEHSNKKLENLQARLVAALTNRIMVHSQLTKTLVTNEFGVKAKKISVIPHANYTQDYANDISRADARSTLNIESEELVFLFLGNIRPYKGVLDLISCFLEMNLPRSRLVIAGRIFDSDEEDVTRAAIGDALNIDLHVGFVADEKVQVFMNAADFVVLPYKNILTSGAVLLAMSFGKACVAPKIGAIPEYLDKTGAVLYDNPTIEDLRAALQDAYNLKGHAAQFGVNNYRKCLQWSWSHVADLTYDVYLQALGRGK